MTELQRLKCIKMYKCVEKTGQKILIRWKGMEETEWRANAQKKRVAVTQTEKTCTCIKNTLEKCEHVPMHVELLEKRVIAQKKRNVHKRIRTFNCVEKSPIFPKSWKSIERVNEQNKQVAVTQTLNNLHVRRKITQTFEYAENRWAVVSKCARERVAATQKLK